MDCFAITMDEGKQRLATGGSRALPETLVLLGPSGRFVGHPRPRSGGPDTLRPWGEPDKKHETNQAANREKLGGGPAAQ